MSKSIIIRIISTAILSGILEVFPNIDTLPAGSFCNGIVYFLIPYIIIGYDIIWKSIRSILSGRIFDENFLMFIATMGVFALALYEDNGDYHEAIAVMLLYQIGEAFQDYAITRNKARIQSVASINKHLQQSVSSHEPPRSEAFITRFARIYTPIVCLGALMLAVLPPLVSLSLGHGSTSWDVWFYRALTFIVISCPCALVVSIPLTFFAGIICGSRQGIFFSGTSVIEEYAKPRNHHPSGNDCEVHLKSGSIIFDDCSKEKKTAAYGISRHTISIVWQNIIMTFGVKIAFLILGAFGIANIWLAIFADTGIMILAVLNSVRAMYLRK